MYLSLSSKTSINLIELYTFLFSKKEILSMTNAQALNTSLTHETECGRVGNW